MPRYSCLVEYDGRPYKGFQAQDNLPTVQGSLERAILGFSGEPLRITAAGRTDTGVHASGQVITFDLPKTYRPDVVRDAMNAYLVPEPIAVREAAIVDDEFSARFSATGRMYLYRILNRRAPPALEQGRVWHVKKPLDAEVMAEAAQHLIGRHDFTTFRDTECQAASPVKTLDIARVKRVGEEIHLVFASRSFLHRQVRSMTGTLVEAGIGRWTVADVKAALEARDRRACGQVAPPEGLCLTHVTFEPEPDFASRSSI
ncbi:tRNA pseudouridine(38-40) synthase TruA [Asticcacaulis sp. DW145]|uniref:tRNA pseudouridine synthase A n=1 Tax=Asticcacaulis currens TaxID=2984210 RepID=A0ABT5ICZ7_9CAUL|nr:tRNA pseudouridine(38-40) synthase TruA [Asticcacaulis currens]MDC7693838.1 tRNA pseudouridine(38-40) synthase TruA [Asticcacaulis currens]BEV10201.1 tRNA pseudouridine(38-40) synthase TruA [Asticcacaulis sp. DW145]